ncbi:hypothetical protein FACS1894184_05900 [Clostridia bacterium]|nr:hypothetical protein FACS1894184_05900 [Clostridia bacterium]
MKDGDYVDKGSIIGKMGDTGAENNVHVHFELVDKYLNGDPWRVYFREELLEVLSYELNVYSNNPDSDVQQWINTYYEKKLEINIYTKNENCSPNYSIKVWSNYTNNY